MALPLLDGMLRSRAGNTRDSRNSTGRAAWVVEEDEEATEVAAPEVAVREEAAQEVEVVAQEVEAPEVEEEERPRRVPQSVDEPGL